MKIENCRETSRTTAVTWPRILLVSAAIVVSPILASCGEETDGPTGTSSSPLHQDGSSARPPEGSYLSSCDPKTFQVHEGALTITCDGMKRGTQNTSTLPDFASCLEGTIINFNGTLACSRVVEPPEGSYKASCTSVYRDGTGLHALCKRKDKKWVGAGLVHEYECNPVSEDITNDNGVLKCVAKGEPNPYPAPTKEWVCEIGNMKMHPAWVKKPGWVWTDRQLATNAAVPAGTCEEPFKDQFAREYTYYAMVRAGDPQPICLDQDIPYGLKEGPRSIDGTKCIQPFKDDYPQNVMVAERT